MLEAIGFFVAFIGVGGLCFVVSTPGVWLDIWLPREKHQPEMPEKLVRLTELADRAIAARQAGQPLPSEIEKFRS